MNNLPYCNKYRRTKTMGRIWNERRAFQSPCFDALVCFYADFGNKKRILSFLVFVIFVILSGCMANQFPVFPSHYRQFARADAPVLSTMVPPPVYPKPVKQWTRETERKKEETETHQYPPWYHLPRYILKTVNQWTSVWGPCHRHHLINPKHPRLSNRGRSDQEISKL